MKFRNQSITESQIQLEVSKIVEQYTKKGYKFYYNFRRKMVVFDLYAINQETNERIIFEFKHYSNYNYKNKENNIERVARLKSEFPDCKVVLVFIMPEKKFTLNGEHLKPVLLKLIYERYLNTFKEIIAAFERFEEVTDLEINQLDFSDDKFFYVGGFGNVTFRSSVENEFLKGSVLNDGVPFLFKVNLAYIYSKWEGQLNKERSFVEFDFSEFIG